MLGYVYPMTLMWIENSDFPTWNFEFPLLNDQSQHFRTQNRSVAALGIKWLNQIEIEWIRILIKFFFRMFDPNYPLGITIGINGITVASNRSWRLPYVMNHAPGHNFPQMKTFWWSNGSIKYCFVEVQGNNSDLSSGIRLKQVWATLESKKKLL